MRKDEGKPSEPKGVYRVKNWKAYNAGLIARGDVTMWIEDSALATAADAGQPKRGRPCAYSDATIQMLLTVKQVYRLPLRALQGFAQSLCRLAFPTLPVPNYTTLSRRAQDLAVVLPVVSSGEPLHLVVDSTGVKLFGEGEWKVRKHGYSKRRSWRKVHLGLDVKTGQVRAALMTHRDVDDASVLPDLLDQIPADEDIEVLGGDGAYDTKAGHAAIAARGAEPSIPPREGATHWPAGTPGAGWRNGVIDAIARSSRQEWKKQSGYHRRSLVENLMYRYKTLTGERFWARGIGAQDTEIAIRVGIVNRMAVLARPQSVRVA
ncbi:transposase [Cupriavidus sp. SK-3]|uniref:IS5 family transposase n=1 Tax=Cupriavidus sp. SK-3 TaxID=1470558 RepID=UPI000449FA31|nr:IS5 family transposase [Cupriavidus sp. SK-3]KDP87468.1 transposase [Cupriavidus sp. SK-3]